MQELRHPGHEGRLAAVVSDITISQSLVQLINDPSVFNFYQLRMKLKYDDRRWMNGFLKMGGLEMLFESLCAFGDYSGSFANLVQRLECVMCIRQLMNSKIGMGFITKSDRCWQMFADGKSLFGQMF